MYSLADHGAMIADRVRMEAFVKALEQTIRPGSVVVDIGTGTGIFALLACRLGARRVYAIEPDDVVQVAREIAAANGCAGRIEFIQALSTEVSLPERADVIVADIGGVLPWFRHHLPHIADARRRLLAPGGVIVPQRDTAWAVIVDAPELHARHAEPWTGEGLGFDMEAARRLAVNTWRKGSITADHLLAEPVRWAAIEYLEIEEPDVRAIIRWEVRRSGIGHGLVAGFHRVLAPGIELSNAPDADPAIRPERIYGTIFFPWPAPVPLAAGDCVEVTLDARLVGEEYVWSWSTRAHEGQSASEKAAFEQSTFLGAPLSPERLRKRAAAYEPALGEEGLILKRALEEMSAGLPLGEIAARLAAAFPGRFPRAQDALGYVGELSCRYA